MKKPANQVNIHEAKTHLSKLVKRAASGEEIIIAVAGEPQARLLPMNGKKPREMLGSARGEVWFAPDYDQADAEIERMFYEESE